MARFSPFKDARVKSAFALYPAVPRKKLMELRQLIIETAAETSAAGPLIETLKWNEPAYLPERPNTGTTIRINAVKGSETRYALFVHCQTTLIETFQQRYADHLEFEGNRAVLFDTRKTLPRVQIKHCIALALTYHTRNSGKSA